MKRSLLALLCLAVACRGDSGPRGEELATAPARRLIGVWDATFWLDRPVTLQADSRLPCRVAGWMAFLEDHSGGISSDEMSDPTHVGVYDVDFRTFGFELRGVGGYPVIVARTVARGTSPQAGAQDSVWIVVGPGTGRGALRLSGAFVADSIAGAWTAAQSLGGGGRFMLQRHPSAR